MFARLGKRWGITQSLLQPLLKKKLRKVQCMYMEALIAALFVFGVANLQLQQRVLPPFPTPLINL